MLRVFGCACFPFLIPYNSSKLQFRSSKCIFLGYSPSHKGYFCLHSSGKIYISPTIEFNEKEFPYHSLFPSYTDILRPTVPSHIEIPDFTSSNPSAAPHANILPHKSPTIQFPSTYSPLHSSDYSTHVNCKLLLLHHPHIQLLS